MKLRLIFFAFLLSLGGTTGHVVAKDHIISVTQSMTLQQQIDTLELGKATLNDILGRFGEPQGYFDFDGNPYKREGIKNDEEIPGWYVMPYHNNHVIFSLMSGRLAQVQVMEPGYAYKGISVGSSIGDVYSTFGKPDEVYDFNPMKKPVSTKKKTIEFRYMTGETPVKLYSTDWRTLGFFIVEGKLVTIVRSLR